MDIWLVDANSYHKAIAPDLQKIKQEYFIIKNHVRRTLLGEHIMPKTRTYSMGLLRIATILKYNDYHVEYVHFRDIERKISTEPFPDVIAFAAVCPAIPMCHDFVKRHRPLHPDTVFVLGGAHVNVAENKTKWHFPLFDRYAAGYDLAGAEKIVQMSLVRPKGEYVDFSLLPYKLSDYSINTCSSVGCPYHCKYCQDRLLPYDIVSKNGFIPYFKETLPPRTCIHFFDSVLGGSKKGLLQLCGEIEKCNHDFLLSCDMRAELLDDSTIEALCRAGFVEIRLGIETADEAVLTNNNRSLAPETLLKKLELCRKQSDLYLTLYSAVGLPGTTIRSVEQTKVLFAELMKTRAVDEIKNCLFVPYPFDDERYSESEVKIQSDNWSDYDRQSMPVYDLPDLSGKQIWQAYLDISQTVVDAWLEGWGIASVEELPKTKYGEYNLDSYSI